jgi:hypothetical protein
MKGAKIMKENIIRKLTSRKFWVAVIGFITPLMIAFGIAEDTTTQVAAIIMAGADVLGYLLAEGLTDAAAAKGTEGNDAV